MGTEPLIRDATPDDLPALRDVRRRAALFNEGDRAFLDAHPEALEYELVANGRTRVAVLDDRIVGFATVLPDRELEDLFVDPDYMRRGIASRLVDDAGAELTVTANEHALAFYERVGFVIDGKVETPGGPAPRMRRAKLSGGAISDVFDGGEVVRKVFAPEWRWKLEKEAYVYALLKDVDVPVARIVRAEGSALVLTKLPGRHVLSLLDGLSEYDLVTINRQLGAILRTVHEVRFDAFGYLGTNCIVEPHATNLDYMRAQFAKKLTEFLERGGEPALADQVGASVESRDEAFARCDVPRLCHNDCHYGNVLVDEDLRVTGLLDLENAVAGDPLLDLAKAHCYGRRHSEATLAALVDGYGGLPEGWRGALDLYVLYHWLELWDWYASVGWTDELDGLAGAMERNT